AYSTIEKECLAIILAVKHFKAYLLGRPFVIQTDHRALKWLHQFREKNSRLTRWSLILQPYTFVVEHKKGRDNANADALSRLEDDTLHKVPEKEGGSVMDHHGITITNELDISHRGRLPQQVLMSEETNESLTNERRGAEC
uniref:Reverse transcriptase RNase H-like domain-containing protein n=1 Tax=Amphimedon queenslandica TaxID=400682 RepID=A0A1X7T9B5_AMPQE